MPRVLVTRSVPDVTLETLLRGLPAVDLDIHEGDAPLPPGELRDRLTESDGLLCTLHDRIDAALLRSGRDGGLRVVANFAVGVDNIDLAAAREFGIVVTNTPDVLTDATAEVAVGLLLSCARRFVEGDAMVRSGEFHGWAPLLHLGHAVYGKTVAIIGAGRIGRRVGETMRLGFGCRVVYHSRSEPADLDALLAEADFVSLHCPLTPGTHHLLDRRRLSLLKPTAVLVNTARGPVVDEEALVDLLCERRIAAAGLDVFEREPALAEGLSRLPNAILLPHIGSATFEARDAMGRIAAQSIVDVLSGKEPAHRVR
jgi:glyoxylate reductase